MFFAESALWASSDDKTCVGKRTNNTSDTLHVKRPKIESKWIPTLFLRWKPCDNPNLGSFGFQHIILISCRSTDPQLQPTTTKLGAWNFLCRAWCSSCRFPLEHVDSTLLRVHAYWFMSRPPLKDWEHLHSTNIHQQCRWTGTHSWAAPDTNVRMGTVYVCLSFNKGLNFLEKKLAQQKCDPPLPPAFPWELPPRELWTTYGALKSWRCSIEASHLFLEAHACRGPNYYQISKEAVLRRPNLTSITIWPPKTSCNGPSSGLDGSVVLIHDS